MGVIPGRGSLRLLAAWLTLALAQAVAAALVGSSVGRTMPWLRGAAQALELAWLLAGALLAIAFVFAWLQVRRSVTVTVERRMAESMPLGQWTDIALRFASETPHELDLEVYDHHPEPCEVEGLPHLLAVPAGGLGADVGIEMTYRLRPRRRGIAWFGEVEIWRRSFLDLVRRRMCVGTPQETRVLPNYRPILAAGLAGIEHRMATLGFHLQRKRGEGLEFQELRDFRDGDTLRQVDWKATARRGKLVARQFQEERDQQVILLLDCGRRMHASEGDLTHFDHVLDAALLLGYVANRQGDAVGVQAFAGEERWLAPVRGRGAVQRLLGAIYDLQTTDESPDYAAAASRLMERQGRRALVLLLTNLRDEDAEELLPAIRTLRRRHLVVVASTREMALDQMRDQPVRDHRTALEVAAAHHYLEARLEAHEQLRATGSFLLDVEPPMLPHALVARYLEIKRAGQL